MTAVEFAAAVVLAIVGGGAGAAAVTWLHDRWKFRAERKAQKEDRAEEKADQTALLKEETHRQEEKLEAMELQINALIKGQRTIMLDRIIYLGQSYIADKEISYEERKRLRDMHDVYHKDLGGNGDADLIMAAVDKLELKQQ